MLRLSDPRKNGDWGRLSRRKKDGGQLGEGKMVKSKEKVGGKKLAKKANLEQKRKEKKCEEGKKKIKKKKENTQQKKKQNIKKHLEYA